MTTGSKRRAARRHARALRPLAALPCVLLALTGAAQPEDRLFVQAGATELIGVYSYMPSDCQARGHTRVEVEGEARLGTIAIRDEVPYKVSWSNYPQCIGVPSAGTGAFYTAKSPGLERIRLLVVYPDGHRERFVKFVTVEAARPAPPAEHP